MTDLSLTDGERAKSEGLRPGWETLVTDFSDTQYAKVTHGCGLRKGYLQAARDGDRLDVVNTTGVDAERLISWHLDVEQRQASLWRRRWGGSWSRGAGCGDTPLVEKRLEGRGRGGRSSSLNVDVHSKISDNQ